MRSSLITLLALALLIAGHSAARAAELTATDAKVSEKKITLSFSVSEMPEIDKVFDYGANIVKIKVPGLNFGSAQLKGDKLKVSDEHGESFYRFTRFSKIEGGGMISIYLKGDLAGATRFLKALKVFTLAESLGGVESLIEHPAIMTHASVPKENREKLGIHDGFIRLSVGVEHVDDLRGDLEHALACV